MPNQLLSCNARGDATSTNSHLPDSPIAASEAAHWWFRPHAREKAPGGMKRDCVSCCPGLARGRWRFIGTSGRAPTGRPQPGPSKVRVSDRDPVPPMAPSARRSELGSLARQARCIGVVSCLEEQLHCLDALTVPLPVAGGSPGRDSITVTVPSCVAIWPWSDTLCRMLRSSFGMSL